MSTDTPAPEISKLVVALAAAVKRHETADRELSVARNAETTALNEVNRLQKAVDAELKALRDSAPRSSDWNRARAQGHVVS